MRRVKPPRRRSWRPRPVSVPKLRTSFRGFPSRLPRRRDGISEPFQETNTLPVRMKDIARDLGISPMAVSKALRNHKDIGLKTRERVQRRAAELNYRIDLVARG